MFNINGFVKKTVKGMIGNYPDFQVREYALGWWSKGKLTDADMEEIDALIEAQYIAPPVDVEVDTETEETKTENTGNETILEETKTEVEPSEMETEIIEDSTNEEEAEAEPLEETE